MTPTPAAVTEAGSTGNPVLQGAVLFVLLINIVAIVLFAMRTSLSRQYHGKPLARFPVLAQKFLIYEVLTCGAVIMLVPFYWMVTTAFKDARTASTYPPVWTPSHVETYVDTPEKGLIAVIPLETRKRTGDLVNVVPVEEMKFLEVEENGAKLVKEVPTASAIFKANPDDFIEKRELTKDFNNFRRAWHRPEQSSRGEVNFFTYFAVSICTSLVATIGTIITSTFAAFAFARLNFWGKEVAFYLVLATMMVPGQVLLIPNFLMLSGLGLLDTYTALTLPWIASVFTIFLMRQFFMTIPEDLWDAARIDGASRFRYLWQVVVPLSKPVFITAGIFDFLNNWNSLLWPLIVTSTPSKRTLMVGLQNLTDDAGAEFHIMMAASCFAILPVVLLFFVLQRFFIEGIARTGLK